MGWNYLRSATLLLWEALNAPSPYFSNIPSRLKFATIAILLGLFLLITFQPFDLHLLGNEAPLIICGYILIAFLVILGLQWFLPKIYPTFFKAENWTFLKQISLITVQLTVIGFINALYASHIDLMDLSLAGMLYFQEVTWLGASIPVLVYFLLAQNKSLKIHLKNARELNIKLRGSKGNESGTVEKDSLLLFESHDNQNNLNIPTTSFIAAKASGNYVELYFVEDQALKKVLIRNTLRNIFRESENQQKLFQCHRSFVVNFSKIQSISGNSRGYALEFDRLPFEVPVSRSKGQLLKNKIANF